MSAKSVKLQAWDNSNKYFRSVHVDSDGNLKVSSPSGSATSANQTIANSSLSSIDGKITACNTDAVEVVASALPSGAATESTLSSLDLKVTTCDTSSVDINSSALPTGAATESTLSSLDLKVTTCDTSAVAVTSSALPSGAATAANQVHIINDTTDISSSVSSLDLKVTNCDTDSISGSVSITSLPQGQSLMSASTPVVISSNQSDVNIKINDLKNLGSHNNLANNVTINYGSDSSTVDVSDIRVGNLFYEDSSTVSYDEVEISVSCDGSNFIKYDTLYPYEDNSSGIRTGSSTNMNLCGITHLKIKNTSSSDDYYNVKATIVGSP
jgi:hypothetical protein